MNRLIRYLLHRICKKLVVQGHNHETNIVEYYRIMREAALVEFIEDSETSLNAFLRECHDEACEKKLGEKS